VYRGGIFLLRKIRDNPIWQDKPFTKGQAWVDMLLQANHKDVKVLYKQQIYDVKRGQFIRTERDLAADWGWSRSKVTRVLDLFKKCSMIVTKPAPRANLITILNYDELQTLRTNNEPRLNQDRTKSEPRVNLNKNDKNEKNEKNEKNKEKIYKKEISSKKLKTAFAEHVFMTQEEMDSLNNKYGEARSKRMIETLDNYIGANPKKRKYESHYRAILSWVAGKVLESMPMKGEGPESAMERRIREAKEQEAKEGKK